VSQESVELVRRIYEAWSANESARDLIHPELEYVNPSYAVESGTRHDRRALGEIRQGTRTSASSPNVSWTPAKTSS